MNSVEKSFEIRMYGFSELAQQYFPNIEPKSAAKNLRSWIKHSEALQEKLAKADYTVGQRILSPRQVQVLIEHLGEP